MNRALPLPLARPRAPALRPRSGIQMRLPVLRLMSRHSFLWLCAGAISGLALFAAFLLIGSDLVITTILCAAWFTAWAAVSLAGGFRTMVGWFAFFPLFHFLLFSLPLKVLMRDEAERHLRAPLSTALVMLLFFGGIFCAVLATQLLKIKVKPLCSGSMDPKYYRALAWTCFLIGAAAYFIAQFGVDSSGGGTVGGSGLAHNVASFTDFSIAAYVFYTWRTGLNLWKQPIFWLLFLSGIFLGILTSTKTGASQPIVFMIAAICSIYGFRSLKLLIGILTFTGLFSIVIYPVMHYARGVDGARSGSFTSRFAVIGSITASYLTDAKFRSDMKSEVDQYAETHYSYLPESTGVFDRFIMIGNTDDLVAGVDQSGNPAKYHGFELFTLGFELLTPRFLYPDKPDVGSSEFLADVAGTRASTQRTNPVWGWPGELYYSYGLPGVFIGAFALELAFFILVNLTFGGGVGNSVWFCFAIVSLNMANSCAPVDSLPLTASLCVLAVVFSKCASLLSRPFGRVST